MVLSISYVGPNILLSLAVTAGRAWVTALIPGVVAPRLAKFVWILRSGGLCEFVAGYLLTLSGRVERKPKAVAEL